jgi:hypothetical protein
VFVNFAKSVYKADIAAICEIMSSRGNSNML